VVWVVVVSVEVLWSTGIMYRHLVFRPGVNFTTAAAEAHTSPSSTRLGEACFRFRALLFCYYILLKFYFLVW
jgi:hypothetical protein